MPSLLIAVLLPLFGGSDMVLPALAVAFAMGVAPLPVVLAHALGRLAAARLARLPIGRPELRVFVRLDGMDRTGARLGALVAGAAAAYLAVAALAFAFVTCRGLPTGVVFVAVGEVMHGFDADGKLQPGDRILAVDGEPLLPGVGRSLRERVNETEGAPVTLTIDRGGAWLDVTLQPKLAEPDRRDGIPMWLLGLRLTRSEEIATDAATAAAFAIRLPLAQVRGVAEELASTFEAEAPPDPGGPVRIVEEYRRGVSFDQVSHVAWLWALPQATFALLVLAVLDLVGAVGLVRARSRRRRARDTA